MDTSMMQQKHCLQHVLRWRLFLEDYNVQFHYIKGESNSLADALSRLPFAKRQNPGDSPVITTLSLSQVPSMDSSDPGYFTSHALDDDNLIDCFAHLPYTENIPYVLDYQTIAQVQAGDAQLQLLQQRQPNKFQLQLLAPNTSVLVYLAELNKPWKICLPDALLPHAICWYHYALSHIGQRIYDTMSMMYYHHALQKFVEAAIKPFAICQQYKNVQRGHGQTAPCEVGLLPDAVDLIGPWTLDVVNQMVKFHALTIIDLVTNLVEIVCLDNKTTQH
jgi:hypothetical protein